MGRSGSSGGRLMHEEILEVGSLPPRTTVYEDDEGEQRAFPHDYGPVYEETVVRELPPRRGTDPTHPAARLQDPVRIFISRHRWRRVERDPDDGSEQS